MPASIPGWKQGQDRPGTPIQESSSRPFFIWLRRNWILTFALLLGVYTGLPFLAPVLMEIGWSGAGRAIYLVYSFLCHQLPQRSFFLFGPQAMIPLADIQAAWQNTENPLLLRRFIGDPALGWKVAWSDRMVAMFASTLLFGLLWWPLRRQVGRLPWWGLVLFLLPMAIDGFSHLISDLSGLAQGFRVHNVWLAILTGGRFPADFYAGDALGSFNSWMRLLSGLLFGLGVVWFSFPYLDEAIQPVTPVDEGPVHSGAHST